MTDLDPRSPEWTIAFAARQLLRRHLGPRHGIVPELLAKAIVEHLRLSRWRITKEPPAPPASTPGAAAPPDGD